MEALPPVLETGDCCSICGGFQNVVENCRECSHPASGRLVSDKMRDWECLRFSFDVPELVFGVDLSASVLPICSACLQLMETVDRLETQLRDGFASLVDVIRKKKVVKEEPDGEPNEDPSTVNGHRRKRRNLLATEVQSNPVSSSDETDKSADPDFNLNSRTTRSSRRSRRKMVVNSPPVKEENHVKRRGRPRKIASTEKVGVKKMKRCVSQVHLERTEATSSSPEPSDFGKQIESNEAVSSLFIHHAETNENVNTTALENQSDSNEDDDDDTGFEENFLDDALIASGSEISCKQCGAKYLSLRTLKLHEQSAHGEASPFQCPHCPRTFLRESVLRRHTKEVHFSLSRHRERLQCPECPKTCANNDLLRSHLHKVHGSSPSLPCKKCDRKFVTSKDVRRHTARCDGSGNETAEEPKAGSKKTTSGENDFAVCQICGVTARGPAARGKINYHVTAVHEKVKKFKCHLCPEAFEHHGSRRRHLARAHKIGVESFQFTCDVCGQFFEAKRDMERHKFSKHQILMRDIQVYTCQHCNKQFIKKQAFEGHLRLHAGIKPHTCPQCDYSSTLFGALKRHMRVAHGRNVKRVFAEGCREETVYTLVDVDEDEEKKNDKNVVEEEVSDSKEMSASMVGCTESGSQGVQGKVFPDVFPSQTSKTKPNFQSDYRSN